MDLPNFLNTVRSMRMHQRAYFLDGRKQSDLVNAKHFERVVDKALAEGIIVPIVEEGTPFVILRMESEPVQGALPVFGLDTSAANRPTAQHKEAGDESPEGQ